MRIPYGPYKVEAAYDTGPYAGMLKTSADVDFQAEQPAAAKTAPLTESR